MSNIQIPNLPAAIALNGGELLEAVQSGVSVRITTAQLGVLLNIMANATIYGQFNTVLPVYSSGDTTAIQTDSNGRLLRSGPVVSTGTATVIAGNSLSDVVDVRGGKPVSIQTPANLRGLGAITSFSASYDGVTYTTLLGSDGASLPTIPLTASTMITLVFQEKFFNYMKLQFDTTASGGNPAFVIGLQT